MKASTIVKEVTDTFCELMREQGRACSTYCECWKRCECPDTEELKEKIVNLFKSSKESKASDLPIVQDVASVKMRELLEQALAVLVSDNFHAKNHVIACIEDELAKPSEPTVPLAMLWEIAQGIAKNEDMIKEIADKYGYKAV